MLTTLFIGCSNSTTPSDVPTADGNVNQLTFTPPKVVPSLNNQASTGYFVVENNTPNTISDITYKITNTIGSGSAVQLNNNSCSIMSAYSQCTLSFTIPTGTIAGSFSVTASNLANNNTNTALNKSATTNNNSSLPIGVQQILYSTISGPDGINLYYYDTLIAGTPYVLITGVVSSNAVGSFNTVTLVDTNNNPLPSQQVVSGNLGSGLTNLSQGSSFAILLKLPTATNSSQSFKLQTSSVDSSGNSSNIQYSTSHLLQTTSGASQGLVYSLPETLHLTTSNPSQIITIVNTGNSSASISEINSDSSNVATQFSNTNLESANTTTATLALVNQTGAPTTSSATINYNNSLISTTTQVGVYQFLNLPESTTPVPGLALAFSPNSMFSKTSTSPSVTRQLIIGNTGNSTENNITISGLPIGFTLTNGTSSTPCTVSGTSVSNNIESGNNCDVTVTYSSSTVTPLTSGSIQVSYSYGTSQSAPASNLSFSYLVAQSTANLSLSPNMQNFATILNNSLDSNSYIFTLANSGEENATGINTDSAINGLNSNLFTINNSISGITSPCSSTLAPSSTCQIGVMFGPSSQVGNALANLAVSYLQYNSAPNSVTTNSAILSGVISTAQSAIISESPTSNIGFADGNGTLATPYQLQVGNTGNVTYTFSNTGASAATNFYLNLNNLSTNITILNNNCGTSSAPITLNALNGTCQITFSFVPTSSGGYRFNFAPLSAVWNDQANPTTPISQALSGIVYVNVYNPASILISTNLDSSGNLTQGESFTITANLIGGYNTNSQTISFGSLTPADGTITYSTNSCQVSNTISACSTIVSTTSSSTIESHTINISNGGGITITPSLIGFNVIAPVSNKVIFITSTSYNGNLAAYDTASPQVGVHGGDSLCQARATSAGLSGTYKALLLSGTRYPCSSYGCGANYASDWVIAANTQYQTTNAQTIITSDSNGIFETNFTQGAIANENGTTANTYFWNGISYLTTGVTTDSTSTLTGWYTQIPSQMTSGGGPEGNCNNWTSNDQYAYFSFVGDSGRFANNNYSTDGLDANSPYATSYAATDINGISISRWVMGNIRGTCNSSYPLFCVQQ
jgi:hypothetical protein